MTAVALVQQSDNADVQAAFEKAEAHFGHVPNLVRALGTNAAMCRTITAFMIQSLQEGRVSWKFKEIVVLKTLASNHSHYSYGAHEAVALALGNTPTKVGAVANSLWQISDEYTQAEKDVLELVDQIGRDANDVSDELWDRLRANWDAGQLVELDALITTFILIGKVGDTLGVSEPVLFTRNVA